MAPANSEPMKVGFLSKINTLLFVIPVLFILAIYLGIGMWLYISGASYLLKDFHAAQLVTMLADKKNAVDLWFDVRKKYAEDIAKSGVVADSLRTLLKGQESMKEADELSEKEIKKIEDASMKAGLQISKYLEGFSQFRTVSFISKEGTVVWSTNAELIDREWPDKDIFGKVPSGRAVVAAGKAGSVMNVDELFFAAPLTNGGQELDTLLIAQPNPADLAASLKVEEGFYKTGKVSIIDTGGSVVAAKDMTDVGKVRYNVPQGGQDGVGYRNGLFYTLAPLKFEQLRLIATLDAAEAAKPLRPLTALYFSFAVLIIAVVLVQSFFVAPRLIGKPLSRLRKATQSLAEGDLRMINLRKGYAGELKILAEAFTQMIVGLNKKWQGSVSDTRTARIDRTKVVQAEVLSSEVKTRLEGIGKGLEGLGLNSFGSNKDIAGITAEIKGIIATIDAFNELVRIRDGSIKLSKKECVICDLLKEVEDECRWLAGGKEIEIIVDCSQTVGMRTICADPKLLKRLATALMRHVITLTSVGTVTLLASLVMKEESEYLELTVSDTGRGTDVQAMKKMLKDSSFSSRYLDLGVARDLTWIADGKIEIEGTPGEGSVIMVAIPASAQASDTPEEEESS